jgi:Leucine-rich repeat (LRR) protein
LKTEELPTSIGQLMSLHIMYLSRLPLKTLPWAFGALSGLQELKIEDCGSFEELLPSIGKLTSLRTLHLCYFPGLKTLSSTFGALLIRAAGAED